MNTPKDLFDNNLAWANSVKEKDPDYFEGLAAQQKPEYLWIGCSDSRIAANQIVGMEPGSIFVHRNIANVVVHTDFNCLSVIQYAVEVLQVKHIVVVGHYGCGGVCASMEKHNHGLIDSWLEHIRDVHRRYQAEIDSAPTQEERENRLCEFNVKTQVEHVTQTSIVREAWKRNQDLTVHGWIYGLKDGVVRDLEVSQSGSDV